MRSRYYGERLVGMLRYGKSKKPEEGPHCFKEDYDLGGVRGAEWCMEASVGTHRDG